MPNEPEDQPRPTPPATCKHVWESYQRDNGKVTDWPQECSKCGISKELQSEAQGEAPQSHSEGDERPEVCPDCKLITRKAIYKGWGDETYLRNYFACRHPWHPENKPAFVENGGSTPSLPAQDAHQFTKYLHTERGGHLLHCNGDHDGPIGGPGCICSPLRLWRLAGKAEKELAERAPSLPTQDARQFYEQWRSKKYGGNTQPWPYSVHAEVCEFAEAYAGGSTPSLDPREEK